MARGWYICKYILILMQVLDSIQDLTFRLEIQIQLNKIWIYLFFISLTKIIRRGEKFASFMALFIKKYEKDPWSLNTDS